MTHSTFPIFVTWVSLNMKLRNNYTSNKTKNNSFKAVLLIFFLQSLLTCCLKISPTAYGKPKGHCCHAVWLSLCAGFTAVCKTITGTQRPVHPQLVFSMPCSFPRGSSELGRASSLSSHGHSPFLLETSNFILRRQTSKQSRPPLGIFNFPNDLYVLSKQPHLRTRTSAYLRVV